MEKVRRTELLWQGVDVEDHRHLEAQASAKGLPLQVYIKNFLKGLIGSFVILIVIVVCVSII